MLAAEPTSTCSGGRYSCLDLLSARFEGPSPVASETAIPESVILLEVWDSGGSLQSEREIPAGSVLHLSSAQGTVSSRVSSCVQDEYGYIVEFAVNTAEGWFPLAYRPAYLLPAPAHQD
jgi:hypothetical protein